MWIFYALASALFAGTVAILAKIGVKDVDSTLATALRTIVVAVFAWLMVAVAGAPSAIAHIVPKSLLFLILSGLATGLSWLCHFRALQLGDVNKVVPVDKSSTVLTLFISFLLLGEGLTLVKTVAMLFIGAGTYLMIERKDTETSDKQGRQWLLFALLSAVFASLTAILGKIGITGVESNLGTALRTLVVLLMAWILVFLQGKQKDIKGITRRNWRFLVLSGLATGLSWLCFYRALQDGPVSVVVPIDKLSILVTVAFSALVLRERLSKKSLLGLLLITAGTLSLIFFP